MRKNRIRLTESQLHQVIKESVKNVLREGIGDDRHYEIGRNLECDGRKHNKDYYEMMDFIDHIAILNWVIDDKRLSNDLKQAASTILAHQETIKDSILNSYREWLDSCRGKGAPNLNQSITNGKTIRDRWEFKSDKPYSSEPEDWYERNEHGDFDNY